MIRMSSTAPRILWGNHRRQRVRPTAARAKQGLGARRARSSRPVRAPAPWAVTRPAARAAQSPALAPVWAAQAWAEQRRRRSTPPLPAAGALSFDVTTSALSYRYQPIGAIWIEDANGKLVKSIKVWASIRRRWLTRYASALSGSAVDVTASATLSSHKTHHATWNLKDRSGAPAPAGKYRLVIELTEGDQTGRSSTLTSTRASARRRSPRRTGPASRR